MLLWIGMIEEGFMEGVDFRRSIGGWMNFG